MPEPLSTNQAGHGYLQPVPEVPGEWLAPFDATPEARRLDRELGRLEHVARLQADTDLYVHLALRKFAGCDWDQFVRLLTGYAYQVITAWTATGAITRHALDHRVRGVPTTPRPLRRDDLDELVTDIVHTAICVFRDQVLATGRWRASEGASLKTFFIGQCLIQYPGAYRRWTRAHPHWEDPIENPGDIAGGDDPDRLVPGHVDLEARLHQLPPHVVRCVQYRAAGYYTGEIAELIARPETSVRSALATAQRALRRTA